MERQERRRRRKRGIVLATGGLLLAMAVGLALRLLGISTLHYGHWLAAVTITLVVQSLLWLIPHFGWDEHLRWDPHYVLLPTLAAACLLDLYVALAPDSRMRVLMVWFVVLLFMAGRAGFRDVLLLSSVMTTGWLLAVWLHSSWGEPILLSYELSIGGVFWVISLYAGAVFERLRHERLEMLALRRQLAELALTDPLTALPNRRHFEETLRAELARILRNGGRLSVVMVDVDFFKTYNDCNGHMAGDGVLTELAGLLRRHVRSGDLATRYGGEEFALLMPGASKEEGVRVVERLRSIVEQHPFSGREAQPEGRLTISAGVAACPEDGCEQPDLLRHADTALYAAKRAGRNRVGAAGQ
jgi:diguanylate cyclase (GGDEF)-like protein